MLALPSGVAGNELVGSAFLSFPVLGAFSFFAAEESD